jgi:hypothetical protein
LTEQTTKLPLNEQAFNTLSDMQKQRVAALHVAREVLASRTFASSNVGGAGALDLYYIAEYIVTGDDPWGALDDEPHPVMTVTNMAGQTTPVS